MTEQGSFDCGWGGASAHRRGDRAHASEQAPRQDVVTL